MFKWGVALLLMFLYQYWVYSLFWTDANAVSEVEGVQHFSGSISRIECSTYKKKFGVTNDRVYIKLEYGQELSFLDRGVARKNCKDFYQQLEEMLSGESSGGKRPLTTEIRGEMYPELVFEGYFLGTAPLFVSFDGQEWINFQEQKESQRGFALFLSLTPIFSILFVMVIRRLKNR